jgi:sigma-E factor negative regulatory protein RseA
MKPHPAPDATDPPGPGGRDWLSAAADGDREALAQACQAWRGDAQARADWHAYHLIGDVMRSDELAAPAARDAAFLDGLRTRLAAEPAVLAPVRTEPRQVMQGWRLPAAVAAGFMAVAGVLLVSRLSAPAAEMSAQTLAAANLPSPVVTVGLGAVQQQAPQVGGAVIRDPRLDEFLRAHQSAKGGFAGAMPGSSLRRVDTDIAAGAPR